MSPAPFIDVVYFAGAGGSSEAYRLALGRDPDIALNHNSTALSVHQVNFPRTEHYVADVFDVDPRALRPGVRWRSFWASPDCRHFSKAKGGAPVSPRIRGLAWIVVKVARLVRPDVIFLENVEEFQDWCQLIDKRLLELRAGYSGPVKTRARRQERDRLLSEQLPEVEEVHLVSDPERKGETFRLWVKRLRQCGYVVEHRELVAADYGAPTTRKRLFLIARCDGKPISWPAPTHAPRALAGAKGLKPYRAAAEIIDWSIPTPSIFGRKRPLQPKTCARIAKGIRRYVVEATHPFIVPITHSGLRRTPGVDEPLHTAMAGAPRHGLVTAYLGRQFGSTVSGRDMATPHPTVMSDGHGGKSQVVTAHLTREFGRSIGSPATEPVGVVTPGGCGKTSVSATAMAPVIDKYYGSGVCADPAAPLDTATQKARFGLGAAFMEQANTGMIGRPAGDPVSTVVGKGCTQRLVETPLAPFPLKGGKGGIGGERADDAGCELEATPPPEPFASAPHSDTPNPGPSPLEGEGRRADVQRFLWEHFGEPTEAEIADPLATSMGRLRFGLVILNGVVWQIVDIGMRMLIPAELAVAQGFGPHYITHRNARGEPVTKTEQTRQIGNSVSPINGAAVIACNLDPEPEHFLEAA